MIMTMSFLHLGVYYYILMERYAKMTDDKCQPLA